MADYKMGLDKLKKAGIKPEVGAELSVGFTDGTKVNAKITKVEKDAVIVTSE